MNTKLVPKKLGKEPLIDVICGIHFESDVGADTLLPGLLLSELSDKKPKFETLPAAQLPQMIRNGNPELQNAPLMRVVIDEQFAILIAPRWLGVGCLMPYAGWTAYKSMIQRVFNVAGKVPTIKNVTRLSLKYVDLIENSAYEVPLSQINLDINIAGHKLSNQVTQLRTEIVDSTFVHAVTIISHATAQHPTKSPRVGVVIDVDTHIIQNHELNDFLNKMSDLLEKIHTANKAFFFDLLTESGLKELEPAYE